MFLFSKQKKVSTPLHSSCWDVFVFSRKLTTGKNGAKKGVHYTFQSFFLFVNWRLTKPCWNFAICSSFLGKKKKVLISNFCFAMKNDKNCFWKKDRSPLGVRPFFQKSVFLRFFSQKKVLKLKHFCYFPQKEEKVWEFHTFFRTPN